MAKQTQPEYLVCPFHSDQKCTPGRANFKMNLVVTRALTEGANRLFHKRLTIKDYVDAALSRGRQKSPQELLRHETAVIAGAGAQRIISWEGCLRNRKANKNVPEEEL